MHTSLPWPYCLFQWPYFGITIPGTVRADSDPSSLPGEIPYPYPNSITFSLVSFMNTFAPAGSFQQSVKTDTDTLTGVNAFDIGDAARAKKVNQLLQHIHQNVDEDRVENGEPFDIPIPPNYADHHIRSCVHHLNKAQTSGYKVSAAQDGQSLHFERE